MSTDVEQALANGYGFDGPALTFGAGMQGEVALSGAQVRVPLAMMNRHGLVAGATGTGKTKTLQILAEQLSDAGVPVFISDIKGDISGLAAPAALNEKLTQRAQAIGFADYAPKAFPVEFLTLDRAGSGVRLRASVSSFGPILMSKVLDLNDTQQSVLALAFKYADDKQLPILNLEDLRALLNHLNSDEGKSEMAEYGGVATATVGVIIRKIVELEQQEADAFFGSPEFEVEHFLRLADDGRGVISVLELADMQDRPALFSTFMMWLLASLYESLPEVGDPDKPKLVFFFDEAHRAPRGAIHRVGSVAHLRSPRRPEEAGGSPTPEVRSTGGSSPDNVLPVRRQRAGQASKADRCRETEPVVDAPRLVTSPETGGYGLSWCSFLFDVWRPSRPLGDGSGERGRALRCGDARRCHRGKAGHRSCRPVNGERGKRSGGARRVRPGRGAGAPSAVAAGAWRSRRSTPRPGKPATWGRAAANTQHAWMGEGRR